MLGRGGFFVRRVVRGGRRCRGEVCWWGNGCVGGRLVERDIRSGRWGVGPMLGRSRTTVGGLELVTLLRLERDDEMENRL